MSDLSNQPAQQPTPSEAAPVSGENNSGQPSDQRDPRWLPDRIDTAKRAAVHDFLKDLGFDKADDLKSLLTEAKSLKDSQLSELEKAQKAVKTAQDKAEAAERKASELETARTNDRIDTAIRAAAVDARAQYPEDVITWARQSGKDLAALLDKDAKLDDKAVKSLIDEAKKARPAWFASGGPGSPSNAGGKVGTPDLGKITGGKPTVRF